MTVSTNLSALAEEVLAATKLHDANPMDRAARLDALKKAELLRRQLEDPKEAMFAQFTDFCRTASIRTLLDFKSLEKIPRDGSIGAAELAAASGLDVLVLTRMMRLLSATGVVKARQEDVYEHTPFSFAYIEGTEVEFYKLMVDEIMPVIIKMPQYLATHAPEDITNLTKIPFSWANGVEGKTFYESLYAFPARLKQFGFAMTTQEASMPVLGIYPFETLETGLDPERPFLVNIGGGRGHSLLQIKKANPQINRRMILQDRPAVLEAVADESIPGIEKMPYDFFTPQPVKNALAYYIRRCLHNWPDPDCTRILSNSASAMGPDSRLFIAEMVVHELTNTGDNSVYWMDLAMLVIGGRERSEKDFRAVLDSAGLQLVKIWKSKDGPQCVLESKLKSDGI